MLLTNHSSFIRIESLKEETDIRKFIIYIRKKIQDFNNIKKEEVILLVTYQHYAEKVK